MKFTPEGELLLTIGKQGYRSDSGANNSEYGSLHEQVTHGGEPFNPAGRSRGCAFRRRVRLRRLRQLPASTAFTADGDHTLSWGEPGSGPGQFMLPHGVWVDSRGRVLVADRENDRVQAFSQDGEFLDQWQSELIGPATIWVDPGRRGVRPGAQRRLLQRADAGRRAPGPLGRRPVPLVPRRRRRLAGQRLLRPANFWRGQHRPQNRQVRACVI